jgi:hypothetical protein
MKASLCLSSRDQPDEEDDRRSLQFGIGLDLCRYFASVCLWHYYVEQNQIRSEIPGALMSPAGLVLFQYQIAPCFFEKHFNQVSRVAVVINNQDASLFSTPKAFGVERDGNGSGSDSRGRKSTSITLFIFFR